MATALSLPDPSGSESNKIDDLNAWITVLNHFLIVRLANDFAQMPQDMSDGIKRALLIEACKTKPVERELIADNRRYARHMRKMTEISERFIERVSIYEDSIRKANC